MEADQARACRLENNCERERDVMTEGPCTKTVMQPEHHHGGEGGVEAAQHHDRVPSSLRDLSSLSRNTPIVSVMEVVDGKPWLVQQSTATNIRTGNKQQSR